MAFEIIEEGELEGLRYCINSGAGYGGFCGYIYFPKRPLKEPGYEGIVNYVSVHGGVTYAREEKDGSFCYGFDTSHSDSEKFPVKDVNWIKEQLTGMKHSLEKAKELEDAYLLAEGDNEKRVKICQEVFDAGNKEQAFGLGVSIKLMTGKL